jgi:hypothetical protein
MKPRHAFKCGVCGSSTHEPLACDVCGVTLCPDCTYRWVEGHAVVCEMCGDTLKAAAGTDTGSGLEEPT